MLCPHEESTPHTLVRQSVQKGWRVRGSGRGLPSTDPDSIPIFA
jgi:hypothetical protein